METILETLGDWGAHTKDPAVLIEYVRNALRRTISSLWAETDDHGRGKLFCVTVDPALEDVINGYIDRSPAGTSMSMPPQVATRIARAVSRAAEPLVAGGHQLVILTSPSVRAQLKQILDTQLQNATVLSYNEIVRDLDVESVGLVQLPADEQALVGAA
jgi:flagellar biosynthesis protein FlhA